MLSAKMALSRIFAITVLLFHSLVQGKSTPVFVALSAIFFALSLLLGDVDIAIKHKLSIDTLLVFQSVLLHIAAFVYSYELIQKEKISGIFILPLSTMTSRAEYLLAQFLSIALCCLALCLWFTALDAMCVFALYKQINWLILLQSALYGLSAVLCAFLLLTLCRFVSTMNALIYSVALFFIGSSSDELVIFAYGTSGSDSLKAVANFVYYALPNFSYFDILGAITNENSTITPSLFVFIFLYVLALSTVLFLLALIRFGTQALRVG